MGKNTGYMVAGQGGPEDRGLTPLRREIMRVIEGSLRDRGYPPSIREIGNAVGLASTSSVSYQLSVLEAINLEQPGQACRLLQKSAVSYINERAKDDRPGSDQARSAPRFDAGSAW
jgi:SOS-response transcriptional repressor LexA